jgi:hypothetical protein
MKSEFSPVWVSTIPYLEHVVDVYRNTSNLRRFFGAYQMTLGMPRLVFPRAPLCFFSAGRLEIQNGLLRYSSEPASFFGFKARDLQQLQFELSPYDIEKFGSYTLDVPLRENPMSVVREWVRIRSSVSGLQDDLLLAMGGDIRNVGMHQSKVLLSSIAEFRWSSVVGAAPQAANASA